MVTGHYPNTLQEALEYRKDHKDALLITGGTDVMVVKKSAEHIIFLNNIEELKHVEDNGVDICIGAGAVYTDLINNAIVPEILKMAMRKIASPAIRSAGTVAGNICNASPAGDTLPILYALDASVILKSLRSDEIVTRIVPIEEFILGIRKIDLQPDEIVTEIRIPKAGYENATKVYYEKVGARRSEAISKLSFVGIYRLDNDKISDMRFAFGSVGITVQRFKDIEKKFTTLSLSEVRDNETEYISEIMSRIHPIDDQRSSAEYRISVCKNLLKDFIL